MRSDGGPKYGLLEQLQRSMDVDLRLKRNSELAENKHSDWELIKYYEDTRTINSGNDLKNERNGNRFVRTWAKLRNRIGNNNNNRKDKKDDKKEEEEEVSSRPDGGIGVRAARSMHNLEIATRGSYLNLKEATRTKNRYASRYSMLDVDNDEDEDNNNNFNKQKNSASSGSLVAWYRRHFTKRGNL